VMGKGITRFHAVYWPAFLLSAGLELPKKLFVHEYVTLNGQKMSKTTGNILDPIPLIEKYGADALRYYLLAKISPFTDGDFSEEKFKEIYNADLANGLGNLVARVAKLCEQTEISFSLISREKPNRLFEDVRTELENYRFNSALSLIWGTVKGLDVYINRERPWKANLSEKNKILSNIVIGSTSFNSILDIAECLKPFLPETAKKIEEQFRGPKITSTKPLFPRI
jgi:methionyl-tRNA synthetase